MVTTGPFRFSANPIHLADTCAHLGGNLLIHSWWAADGAAWRVAGVGRLGGGPRGGLSHRAIRWTV